jgi:formylglycine-generating enzyme required for sulfatase activity
VYTLGNDASVSQEASAPPLDGTGVNDGATESAAASADASGDDGPEAPGATADAGDAAPGCDADGGMQCSGNTPQKCFSPGRWVDQTPCGSTTFCAEGTCHPMPPSCGTYSTPFECENLAVPGGTYDRTRYDDADGGSEGDASAPATVDPFRLDAYEVTVERFTAFEHDVVLGYQPAAGDGKHGYLNGGLGLLVGAGDAGPVYESGWDPSWAATLATTATDWTTNLDCTSHLFATVNERFPYYPINCVTWYEAYAFCIWDGGFLPTEAEWSLAAAGADEQRRYPWGYEVPMDNATYAIWGCYLTGGGNCIELENDVGTVFAEAAGVGRWGHFQLAGNMAEWTLDTYAGYVTPCVDCATMGDGARVFRGGSFDQDEVFLENVQRANADPTSRSTSIGFRCARAP